MISIIAAVGKNLELGKKNELIWKIKEDMQYFKERTMGHTVIVGLNTYRSFPNGLPGRKMIVLTDEKITDKNKNISTTVDIDGLINKYTNSEEEVFIIGGAFVYSQFINVAHKIYLTEIDDICPDADVYFPKFDKTLYDRTVVNSLKWENIDYQFCIYEKK